MSELPGDIMKGTYKWSNDSNSAGLVNDNELGIDMY